MPLTALRPDYYDVFENFPPEEVSKRLSVSPFHLATLLGVKNILGLSADEAGRSAARNFLSAGPTTQRSLMIEMLKHVGVSQNVALAAERIPREAFIEPRFRKYCYLNHYVPFSSQSCLSAPGLVALMIERLQPEPDSRILEVGIGSGIHAAWISEVLQDRCEIVGLERNVEYATLGMRALAELGYKNISIAIGDGLDIGQSVGRFSRIYITAASLGYPPAPILDRLDEGGILQFVRAITPEEFRSDRPDSWYRRTFQSYEEYLNGEWRSYCCLATARKEGGRLVELSQVYDVTFVPIQSGVIAGGDRSGNPFEALETLN